MSLIFDDSDISKKKKKKKEETNYISLTELTCLSADENEGTNIVVIYIIITVVIIIVIMIIIKSIFCDFSVWGSGQPVQPPTGSARVNFQNLRI